MLSAVFLVFFVGAISARQDSLNDLECGSRLIRSGVVLMDLKIQDSDSDSDFKKFARRFL
jgi:hypothetical protein